MRQTRWTNPPEAITVFEMSVTHATPGRRQPMPVNFERGELDAILNTYGFFVAAGPDIPAGRELHNHSIFDIAPTLLERSGVALPEGLDGQPIPLTGASKPINA